MEYILARSYDWSNDIEKLNRMRLISITYYLNSLKCPSLNYTVLPMINILHSNNFKRAFDLMSIWNATKLHWNLLMCIRIISSFTFFFSKIHIRPCIMLNTIIDEIQISIGKSWWHFMTYFQWVPNQHHIM